MKPVECDGSRPCKPCLLSGLAIGRCGRVLSVRGDNATRRRLLEMGFCNRAVITAVRLAPLGDPIEFQLRGYSLCMRREQAHCVVIDPLPQMFAETEDTVVTR